MLQSQHPKYTIQRKKVCQGDRKKHTSAEANPTYLPAQPDEPVVGDLLKDVHPHQADFAAFRERRREQLEGESTRGHRRCRHQSSTSLGGSPWDMTYRGCRPRVVSIVAPAPSCRRRAGARPRQRSIKRPGVVDLVEHGGRIPGVGDRHTRRATQSRRLGRGSGIADLVEPPQHHDSALSHESRPNRAPTTTDSRHTRSSANPADGHDSGASIPESRRRGWDPTTSRPPHPASRQ